MFPGTRADIRQYLADRGYVLVYTVAGEGEGGVATADLGEEFCSRCAAAFAEKLCIFNVMRPRIGCGTALSDLQCSLL